MEGKIKSQDYELGDWMFLNEELSEDLSALPQLTYQIQFIREFLLCFFIIFFIDYPFLQLIPMLMLYIFTFWLSFKYKPFESKSVMFLTFVNELGYILIIIMFMVVKGCSAGMKESDRYKMLGYPLIFLTSLVVVLNLAVGMYDTYKAIREAISKKKPEDKSTKDIAKPHRGHKSGAKISKSNPQTVK